jgi:hypothetical protein
MRQQPTWPSLLASAIAHALVLALIPTLTQALSGIDYLQAEWASYTPEPLRLELPERVYFPAARPRTDERGKAEEPVPARHLRQVQPAAGAGLSPRAPLPKQMELPITQHLSDQAPVILQPDLVTLPASAVPVAPPLAFWARANQPRVRRRAVIPGRVQTSPVPPNLDAPPVLSLSNAQPVASDIAAASVAVQTALKLPLPDSSTNPVRIRGKGGAEIASFDVPQSDPINLIYLMAANSAARRVEIPKGLQSTPRPEPDGGTGLTPGRTPDDGVKSGGSLAAAHDRMTPGAGGAARVAEAASAAAAAAIVRTPGTAGAGQQDGVAADNSPYDKSPAAEANPAGRPVAPTGAHVSGPVQDSGAAVIRMTHPANGNFDVVVLQSVTRDDLPDVGGTLSGNPVYTVYLSVGDAREWLLEYCIPASVNSRASSYQVNIDDPGVVSAPYPLTTAIPRSVFELPHPGHIVLHGLLSAAGILREVKAPNMDNALVREVLPLLGQWQFRPASRDKAPVEVEILLIIPPRT